PWKDATLNARGALMLCLEPGSTIIFEPCSATCIAFQRGLRLVAVERSDAFGRGVGNVNARVRVCGHSLQLLDIPTCLISNVVRIPPEPARTSTRHGRRAAQPARTPRDPPGKPGNASTTPDRRGSAPFTRARTTPRAGSESQRPRSEPQRAGFESQRR